MTDLQKMKSRLKKKWTKNKKACEAIDYFELLWDCLRYCVLENEEDRTLETLAKNFLAIELVEIEMPPSIDSFYSRFGFKELGFGDLSLRLDLGGSTNPDIHRWKTQNEILELYFRVKDMRQVIRLQARKETLLAVAIASNGPVQTELDFGVTETYFHPAFVEIEKV